MKKRRTLGIEILLLLPGGEGVTIEEIERELALAAPAPASGRNRIYSCLCRLRTVGWQIERPRGYRWSLSGEHLTLLKAGLAAKLRISGGCGAVAAQPAAIQAALKQ